MIAVEPFDPNLADQPRAGLFYSTLSEYLRVRAVSRTVLHAMSATPAHGLMQMGDSSEASPALDFGEAFHIAILEPETSGDRILVGENGLTRAQKAWHEFEARARGAGQVPVTREESRHLIAMRHGLLREIGARRLLESQYREITCVWRHERTGLWLKARFDLLDIGDPSFILDLKTTRDADERKFAYACRDYGYTLQAAMYLQGANTVLGPDRFKGFIIIACEKDAPYRREWYDMRRHIDAGERQLEALLDLYVACSAAGEWPAMQRFPGQPPIIRELPLL